MRVRLVSITKRRSGASARREEVIELDRLTVGRGTDNVVSVSGLAVPLHHSAFVQRPEGIYVEAIDATDLRVSGRVTSQRLVAPGDAVRAGRWELRVVAPRPGEDLALEIEQVEASASDFERLRSRTTTGVEHGLLTKRVLSWTLAVAILGGFLGAPALLRTLGERPGGFAGKVAERLEATFVSGPLSPSHANLEKDCEKCHAIPFEPVRDEECMSCHGEVGRHIRRASAVEMVHQVRCGACHGEHEGERGLERFSSEMCTSCHASLGEKEASATLLDVGDFSDGHPEFRASLVVDPFDAKRERVSLAALRRAAGSGGQGPREESGLEFPHGKHLRKKLGGPDGTLVRLACGDCHVPDRGGALMEPIRFEAHCRRCHGLSFDESHPERQAPHGDPEEVARATFDYYSGLALRGEVRDASAPLFLRRRPGRPLEPQERKAALAWASEASARADAYLLAERGVCGVCHTLRSSAGRVLVAPVVLAAARGAERWFPLARFDHGPHRVATCTSCHDATRGRDAGTVLLPGIRRCRECHGDSGGLSEIRSTCILCHRFHHPVPG